MRRRQLLAAALSLPLTGCAASGWFSTPAPFSQRAPCVLPPDAGKEQIVQHVNRNIHGATPTSQGLASWDSSNVRLSFASNGPSMAVPAFIAVEAPRNFRLRVSMPLHGELADMGSNANEFWLWAKYSPHQNVITASHADLLLAQQRLSLPFHPDWLMEVLGVIPIDPESVTLRRPDQKSQIIELVSEHIAPGGAPLQKVIRIDSCHGVIREHALYDSRGVLIASARLGDHKIDEATGLVMPRVIRLDWPQMQQQITMRFNDMRVNPPSFPPAVWQVPEVPGCPRMELTQLLNSPHAGGLDPFGTLGMPQSAEAPPSRHPAASEANRDPFNDRSAAGGPPSAYSAGASQSSSGRRPRGRGLWRWPWR